MLNMFSTAAELFRGKSMSVPQAMELVMRGPGLTAAGPVLRVTSTQ